MKKTISSSLLFIISIVSVVFGQTGNVITLISGVMFGPRGMEWAEDGQSFYITDSARLIQFFPNNNSFVAVPGATFSSNLFDIYRHSDGFHYLSEMTRNTIWKWRRNTPPIDFMGYINRPYGVRFTSKGVGFAAENGADRIIRIVNGINTTYAEGCNRTTPNFGVCFPTAVMVDRFNENILYFTEQNNNRVKKIDADGSIIAIAGFGQSTTVVDGYGTSGTAYSALAMEQDSMGNIYLAGFQTHYIRKINSTGYVSTLTGSTTGSSGTYTDGTLSEATFQNVRGLKVDNDDNLYVLETVSAGKGRLRKIIFCDPTNQIYSSTIKSCRCLPGFYLSTATLQSIGPKTCTPCPLGTAKSTAGNQNIESCVPCPIGSESDSTRSGCTACPSTLKYRSSLLMPTCADCPGNATCPPDGTRFICQAGFEVNSQGSGCRQCGIGQASPGDLCYQCPAGHEPNSEKSGCTVCPSGRYKPSDIMDFCVACPDFSNCTNLEFTCLSGYLSRDGQCVMMQTTLQSSVSIAISVSDSSNVDSKQESMTLPIPDIFHVTTLSSSTLTPFSSSLLFASMHASSSASDSYHSSDYYQPSSSSSTLQNGKSADSVSIDFPIVMVAGFIAGWGLVFLLVGIYVYRRYFRRFKEVNDRKPSIKDTSMFTNLENIDPTSLDHLAPQITHHNSESGSNSSLSQRTGSSSGYSDKSLRASKTRAHRRETSVFRRAAPTDLTMMGEVGLSIPAFIQFQQNIDFLVEQQLAQGGGGAIYLATALCAPLKEYGRKMVVKVMLSANPNQDDKDMFYQEVSIMYMLRDHRNIAKLLGYTDNPTFSLLLKYCPEGSLKMFVFTRPCEFTKRRQMRFIRNVSDAISYMTSKGLAHCDLKSDNVLLDNDEVNTGEFKCVLTDFGLSCPVNDTSLTVKNFRIIQIFGASIRYASPEALGMFLEGRSRNYRHPFVYLPLRSDLYSMSMIFHEIINRVLVWNYDI